MHVHGVLTNPPRSLLQWRDLPAGRGADGNRVLASADVASNSGTLLVLMPGSGRVRAGVWGRQLLVSDSVEHGSMVEWVQAAADRRWAVVVFDPNPNNGGAISGADCCVESWRAFVAPSPAQRVVVVAHSAGGAWLLECLLRAEAAEAPRLGRLKAFALTDTFQSAEQLDPLRARLL